MTTKTWQISAGSTENWSSGNAWNPEGVPGTGDLAYFNNNVGGVVINVDVDSGISFTSKYTGTVDFNSTDTEISGDVSAVGSNWTGLNGTLLTVHGDFALRDMSLLTDTWDLNLVNSSGTAVGVQVSNCDASASGGVIATNCQDSGNNSNWSFVNNYTVESLPSLLKCVGPGYLEGEGGNALTQNFRETLDPHIMGTSNQISPLQNITSSSTAVTIAQQHTTFENTGTSTPTSFTLPTASGGLEYGFVNHSESGISIAPNTGDQMIVSTGVVSDASIYQTSGLGGVLSIVAIDDTSWIVVSEIGSWSS